MMKTSVAYLRVRYLLFVIPLWLLAVPVLPLKAPHGGDDGAKAYSSSGRPSKLSSEFDNDDNSHSPYDDSDMSESELLGNEQEHATKRSTNQRKRDILEKLDILNNDDESEFSFRQSFLEEEMPAYGKEAMYEAYNQLHTLAQVSFLVY